MQKMGWREGQGLGPTGEGMTTPLSVRRLAGGSGVIVAGGAGGPPPLARLAPSPVLCLTGVVLPGCVDAALEDEVADECEKHGPVVRVVIFESEPGAVPLHEAVRVFVEFVDAGCCARACAEMDGRFFGGRSVRAHPFPADRLEAGDLRPREGEFLA